jgi:hypothetical protein
MNRVTGARLAGREYQQSGIEGTKRVGYEPKTWKLLDSSMGIVDGENVYFFPFLG